MAVAIDTLAYARKLRDAGFTEQQAEGQASALAAAMTDTLATKQDLKALESRLENRMNTGFAAVDARFAQVHILISELEKRMVLRFEQQTASFDAKLDVRLAALEHRMTLRLGGIMVAGIGVISALVQFA